MLRVGLANYLSTLLVFLRVLFLTSSSHIGNGSLRIFQSNKFDSHTISLISESLALYHNLYNKTCDMNIHLFQNKSLPNFIGIPESLIISESLQQQIKLVQVHPFFENSTDRNQISPNKNPLVYSVGLPKLSRKHQYCPFTINILPLFQTKSFPSVEHSIIQWFSSIPAAEPPRLSRDHFIFISPFPKLSEHLLLSKDVGLKLENKLAVTVHPSNETKSRFKIQTSCLFCNNGNPGIINVPKINSKNAFNTWSFNLKGTKLRFSIPQIPPRMHMHKSSTGVNRLDRGLYKYLMEDALQPRFNISYSIVLSERGSVGDYDPKRGFTGVLRDVLLENVDIGLCVGYTINRFPYIGYTTMFEAEYLTFSSGKRQPYTSWRAVFWTFRPFMWACTLAAFPTAVIVLYTIARLTAAGQDKRFGLMTSADFIFAAFFDQGSTSSPTSVPARIFCSCWLFYSLVVSNAFREKLFGYLGFPQEIHLPQSFQELAASKFQIGLQFYGGAAYNYIKTSQTSSFTKIAERMVLETDPIRCFTKSLETDFSCIHYYGAAEFVKARNLSDRYGQSNILVAPASTLFLPISAIMKKESVLMEKVNQVVGPVRDMGLMERWKKMDFRELLRKRVKWEMDTGIFKESDQDTEHVKPIRIKQLLGPFGLLLAGEVISAMLFIYEAWKSGKRKKYWKKLQTFLRFGKIEQPKIVPLRIR